MASPDDPSTIALLDMRSTPQPRLSHFASDEKAAGVTGSSRQRNSANYSREFWISIVLHLGLLLLHVILLIVYIGKWERHVTVKPGSPTNTVSSIISVASQAIATLYLAIVVFYSQRLAVRRIIHDPQTIATIHDKISAWTGVGAAAAAVFRQFDRPTKVKANGGGYQFSFGVLGIAVYLACISGLHITAPSLFSLEADDQVVPAYVLYRTGRMNTQELSLYTDFGNPIKVLQTLSLLMSRNATVGLMRNVIYDQLDPSQGHGNVTLAATSFNISCANLPTAKIADYNSTAVTWNLVTPVGNRTITPFTANAIRIPPFDVNAFTEPADYHFPGIVVLISANITDSNGKNGTYISLDPPVVPYNNQPYNYSDMTIITCNIRATTFDVQVDAQTRLLNQDVLNKTEAYWLEEPDMGPQSDPLEAFWAAIFNVETAPSGAQVTDQCTTPPDGENFSSDHCQITRFLTIVEEYINGQLGMKVPTEDALYNEITVPQSISLTDLEVALENATAAVYWASTFTGSSEDDDNSAVNVPNFNDYAQAELLEALVYTPGSRLHINVVQVSVGLGLSIVLFGLALGLGRRLPSNTSSVLDGVGLLQIIWLLGRGSSIQDRVADVQDPSTDNLREATRFEITLDEMARMRKVWSNTEEGDG